MDQSDNDIEHGAPSASHPGNQPDVYVNCPYFPEHELRRSRMPYHIIKCQSNPRAPKLLACPYNYLHRVKPEDQQEHLATCEDRMNKRFSEKGSSYRKTTKHIHMKENDRLTTEDIVPPETGEVEWW